MKNLTILIATIFLIASCDNTQTSPEPPAPANPLLGSWEMQEVHWITKDTTYSIEKAQPGILMLTPKRYAIIWTPIDKPRTPFVNLSKPTDEEKMAGFQSIVFNSGTYEMTDSTMTTTALVAKVPGFEGGKQFYNYTINDGVLKITMFDETYPNGDKPGWFGKYKTQFVLKKVD
ncbi:MAG TPA: hypothetical protein ENJ95_12555 [Bacteroidetes bacterium]|nr:hypothetical protein [Bacteroidota bacterium]